tara:strand:- start:1664 stop:1834 length:171 start_codon:yes stop_codon:yes gene_type:complete
MAKNKTHYLRSGKEFTGKTHKMSNGVLHTGKNHTKNSKPLFHFNELSKTTQKKLRS